MTIDEYQQWTINTAIYPGAGKGGLDELLYLALGLNGEAGEVAEKVKKLFRDGTFDTELFIKELGDVIYYWARLCEAVNVDASEVILENQWKLNSRLERGKIQGSGDER